MEVFKYKGKEYRLKPIGLCHHKLYSKIDIEVEKIVYKAMQGIDTSVLDAYTAELKTLYSNFNDIDEARKKNEATPEQLDILKKIEGKISEINEEMGKDSECSRLLNFKTKARSRAYEVILYDEEFLKSAMELILDGDTGKIDYNDVEIVDFAGKVIKSFFLSYVKHVKTQTSS